MPASPCRSCGGGKRLVIPTGQTPSSPQGTPDSMWEVFSARGQTTGRKFTSRLAADGYAGRIGGTVKPA